MTGLIPRPFIDEVINRTDLVELIDAYVPLKKRGTSFLACCPFHGEKTPSFNVVPKKQFYHCFGCGASGNAISFAMNYLHLSFTDAVETLAAKLGMEVPREGGLKKNQPSVTHYQVLGNVAQFYQKNLKQTGNTAIDYLKNRHVSGEIAHTYQLGYASPGWHTLENAFKSDHKALITTGMLIEKENNKTYDRYRDRIMFPIHDHQGRIIGFGGRALDNEQKPKYLNSPETIIFQKSRVLYGLHQALEKETPLPVVIVVEGYMDVIALAQHGVCNAVATLGTATSSYHIQLLSKYTKRLLFCFDGDNAGQKAAWRALESSLPYLNTGIEASFIFLPEQHDPDSLIREEGKARFLTRLEQAIPLHRYLFNTLMLDIDITTLAGKSQLMNAAKPYLLKMGEGPYQQLLLDELARFTRIDAHRIDQLIQEKSLEKTSDANKQITRSPIRLAVALLLQHPGIFQQLTRPIDLESLDDEKHATLKTLIAHIAKNTYATTATLIECWRDTPLFDSMIKLAAWDHQVPEQALAKEFMDIVVFLEKQTREQQIRTLMEKAHRQTLNETERMELQRRLKERHKRI